jgi:hypothetical protein
MDDSLRCVDLRREYTAAMVSARSLAHFGAAYIGRTDGDPKDLELHGLMCQIDRHMIVAVRRSALLFDALNHLQTLRVQLLARGGKPMAAEGFIRMLEQELDLVSASKAQMNTEDPDDWDEHHDFANGRPK